MLCYSEIVMEKNNVVRGDITLLITQVCGGQIGKFFSTTYSKETLPIFLHHSFLVLKEMVGAQKAREQLNTILRKNAVIVPYE